MVQQKTEQSDGGMINSSKISRAVLEKHLNREELTIVDKLLKEDKTIEQLLLETAAKLASL